MTKRLHLLVITLLAFNLMTAPVTRASFDDIGAGGRGPGMADALTGVADDANAIVYNPAGLVHIKEGELTSEYSQFLKGLDDGSSIGTTYLGYAHPLRQGEKGVLGIAYHNFKAANLLTERTLSLAYGWKLKVEPFGWKGKWSLGSALKQLHRQYQPDRFTENALNDGTASGQADPLFANNGYATDAYALDVGALYQFGANDKYSAGLSLKNVNQPDVSLGGDGDKAPLAMKLGLSYRPTWGLLSAELRRVTRLQNKADTEMALGAERVFPLQEHNAFVLRGGYSSGSRDYKTITAGVSYLLGRAEFDYAFNFPTGNLSKTDGSHRLGFSYKVGTGLPKPETKEEKVKKPEPVVPAETTTSESDAEKPLPEAPTALTAPVPVLSSTETTVVNEFDLTLRHFGVLLGYYVKRAHAGASVDERRALLREIKERFGNSGIDMGYVDSELKSIGTSAPATPPAPAVAPKPAPVMEVVPIVPKTTPAAKPAVKPDSKKTGPPKVSPDIERAWNYYRQAVERGITDSERIEILENILMRFGESNADKVAKELEKVRRRLE